MDSPNSSENEPITASGPAGTATTTTMRGRLCPSPRSRWSSCWLYLIGICNTIGLVGMGIAIFFLFAQLQYVTYKLNQEQKQILALQAQVEEQQADQIQQLSEQVEQQKDYTVYQLAGTFCLLTCLLTMFHMAGHLRHMHEPEVQRKIITILWMSPIYSVTSFLSLTLPKTEMYLSIIKDFYEAYVVYTFLSFLIAVLGRGDRNLVVSTLAQQADHMEKPARCLRRFYDPPPEASPEAKANAVLLSCQIMAMQFVLVRPLTSIASFLVYTISNDSDHDGLVAEHEEAIESDQEAAAAYFLSPNFAIAMVENISVFFAFNGLLKFYHLINENISWLKPFNKFLAIKGIVFLTFWQGLAIMIVVHLDGNNSDTRNDREQAMAIQNLLICMEMLFFSLAHWCVFPPEEWEPGYRPKQMARPGLGFRDFGKDVRTIMGRRPKQQQGALPIPQSPGEEDEKMDIEMNTDVFIDDNHCDDDNRII